MKKEEQSNRFHSDHPDENYDHSWNWKDDAQADLDYERIVQRMHALMERYLKPEEAGGVLVNALAHLALHEKIYRTPVTEDVVFRVLEACIVSEKEKV